MSPETRLLTVTVLSLVLAVLVGAVAFLLTWEIDSALGAGAITAVVNWADLAKEWK